MKKQIIELSKKINELEERLNQHCCIHPFEELIFDSQNEAERKDHIVFYKCKLCNYTGYMNEEQQKQKALEYYDRQIEYYNNKRNDLV